ncbi:MAG: hypothetical protein ACXAB2_03690 [Candidatus Hodarchaeales archaeon]
MSFDKDFEISYLDESVNAVKKVKASDLKKDIDRMKNLCLHVLKTMQTLGNYELAEFSANASIEADVWIIKANGGVTFKWEKKK